MHLYWEKNKTHHQNKNGKYKTLVVKSENVSKEVIHVALFCSPSLLLPLAFYTDQHYKIPITRFYHPIPLIIQN